MRRIGSYFWSLYYLKPSQIWWRLHRLVKDRAVRLLLLPGMPVGRRLPTAVETAMDFPRITSRLRCGEIDLAERRFTFLGDAETLPESRMERDAVARKPLLWQFHYHYQDYLYALLQRNDGEDVRREVIRTMRDWIEVYPAGAPGSRSAAWHPYVLSIRIEIWIRILTEFAGSMTGEDRVRILRSLYRQARTLRNNVEWGTLANHLLRNVKALLFAGRFFNTGESKRWLDWSRTILERELREQILADGCHFERTPMYHVGILSDLCDLLELFRSTEGEKAAAVVSSLREAVGVMDAFARYILHPDGQYPFFNDSTAPETLDTGLVLDRAGLLAGVPGREPPAVAEPSGMRDDPRRYSGIHIFRAGKLYAAFDAGNVGPDYQPGHAHADTLSFECSWSGSRWITDTGVFHYKQSPERTYARSTPAHNTMVVDGKDQSDVWHSFRVGKRARIVERQVRRMEKAVLFQAAHDGYRPLFHERALLLLEERCILVADWIHGTGTRTLDSYLHFHPGIRVEQDREGAIAYREGERCRILCLDPETRVSILETKYFPAFGVAHRRATLRFTHPGDTPRFVVSLILFEGPIPSFRLDQQAKKLQIQTDAQFEFELRPLI